MLQQTQVERVIVKYKEFLTAFPDFPALARSSTPELLRVWSGLGYNRRALALKALAQVVMEKYFGRLPSIQDKLVELPGVGKYTAGAIMAFAFNKPAVFLDTNVRRVFIHEFFPNRDKIRDDALLPLVARAVDLHNPGKWYNALMDYGSMLKLQHVNSNRRSAHYTRQVPFKNSNRQVRGIILKMLLNEAPLSAGGIVKKTGMDPDRVKSNLVQLEKEGFVRKKGRSFSL